jgi:hypothetical protein
MQDAIISLLDFSHWHFFSDLAISVPGQETWQLGRRRAFCSHALKTGVG